MTEILRKLFPGPPDTPVVPPGMYQRIVADPPAIPYRLHLRVDPGGRGLLIVNASTVLHLNETATAIAWHVVQGTAEDEAAAWTARRFRVSRARARRDGRLIRDQIEALAEGEDQDPVAVMGMDRRDPYAIRPAVPYRLDLALTYRLGDGQAQDPQARRRVDRELETAEWIRVLDQAWSSGVPHVVFVGGEPTVRDDLLDLVRHAEALGQVAGVVTHASRLASPGRMDGLSQAGVDHLLIVVDEDSPAARQGLEAAVRSDVFSAAHLTLLTDDDIPARLGVLKEAGITHVSVTTPPGPQCEETLRRAEQAVADLGLVLVWDLPVPFSLANPIRLEVEEDLGRRAWLYVEPDGDVLPALGTDTVLGNLTRDSLETVWRRDGEALPTKSG
ncbi:MAG TPA: radical SAM protein [Anaerolineales bacterium]|nr:radical SAM protein [Anaerolineales bacterium]